MSVNCVRKHTVQCFLIIPGYINQESIITSATSENSFSLKKLKVLKFDSDSTCNHSKSTSSRNLMVNCIPLLYPWCNIVCKLKCVCSTTQEDPDCRNVNVTTNNLDVVKNSEVVWIAVKPHIVTRVLREVSPAISPDSQLFISVAAGTKLETMEKVFTPFLVRDNTNLIKG